MANLKGGMILLGVEDDGTISGVQRPKLEEWVMDTVFGAKVHPMMLPFYEEVAMDEGKRVAVVSFPEGSSKPYVLRHHHREEIFIRVGSTSRLATREQQARLFASGGMVHTEVLPVAGATLKALDLERLRDYLTHVIQDPEIPDTPEQWMRRLVGLGLMTNASEPGPLCTIAGLILFGLSPRRYLRQAGLRLLVFEGDDKDYRALLDDLLNGPLVGRWFVDETGNRVLSDGGIIERFVEALRPFITQEDAAIDQHMRRSVRWRYPREAVRETVINALVHRDWTRSVDIEVVLYSDRLEVVSPGALQNTMTVEKMIAGQRSPRNPLIVDIMRDYGYVEARGMGVRTKIIPLMRRQNKTDPVFFATEDHLRTILPLGESP